MVGTVGRREASGRGGERRREEGKEGRIHSLLLFSRQKRGLPNKEPGTEATRRQRKRGSVCAKHPFQSELRERAWFGRRGTGRGGAPPRVVLECHSFCQFKMRLSKTVTSAWCGESRSGTLELQEQGRGGGGQTVCVQERSARERDEKRQREGAG